MKVPTTYYAWLWLLSAPFIVNATNCGPVIFGFGDPDIAQVYVDQYSSCETICDSGRSNCDTSRSNCIAQCYIDFDHDGKIGADRSGVEIHCQLEVCTLQAYSDCQAQTKLRTEVCTCAQQIEADRDCHQLRQLPKVCQDNFRASVQTLEVAFVKSEILCVAAIAGLAATSAAPFVTALVALGAAAACDAAGSAAAAADKAIADGAPACKAAGFPDYTPEQVADTVCQLYYYGGNCDGSSNERRRTIGTRKGSQRTKARALALTPEYLSLEDVCSSPDAQYLPQEVQDLCTTVAALFDLIMVASNTAGGGGSAPSPGVNRKRR